MTGATDARPAERAHAVRTHPRAAARPQPAIETRDADRELRWLQRAQTISRVGSWVYLPEAASLHLSDELVALFGFADLPTSPGWTTLTRCIHPEDQRGFAEAMRALTMRGEPLSARFRVYRDGRATQPVRWFDARGAATRDPHGRVVEIAGTIADVTDRVQDESSLREAHAELVQAVNYQQAVITATPDVIHVYDVRTGRTTRANRTNRPPIGFTDEAVRVMSGELDEQLLPVEYAREWRELIVRAALLPDGDVVQMSHPVLHAHEPLRWLSRRLTPFERDDSGMATRRLVVTRDVTDDVAVERRLAHAATHDDLTGLPNRRLFQTTVDDLLTPVRTDGQVAGSPVIIVCDLDGFKRVNDAHGHQAGDAVLRAVAERLVEAVRHEDLVARIGGDEFAVLLRTEPGEDADAVATLVAERITESVSLPIPFNDRQHRVTCSVGTRVLTFDSNADTAMSDADSAMYFVKRNGANGHAAFAPTMRTTNDSDDRTETAIRSALADGTVGVGYQPIVDPRSNRIEAVEALIRLCDTDGAALNAAQVIQVAELRGLVTVLDAAVRGNACAQLAVWRREPDLADLTLNINCSAQEMTRPGFGDRMRALLAQHDLPANALTIEITETVLLDASQQTLRDLRALQLDGVGLAIDDFGTGYASLRYLAELPITCIKLDRSFTRKMLSDHTSKTLVRTTISLAEQLGIRCTVEGIETSDQLEALPAYPGLNVQGYLYSAALAPPEPPSAVFEPKSGPRTGRASDRDAGTPALPTG